MDLTESITGIFDVLLIDKAYLFTFNFIYRFIMFNEYRIPRDNLISNSGDITDEGDFKSAIKDPKKNLGASLGSLSGGRVNISGEPICIPFVY